MYCPITNKIIFLANYYGLFFMFFSVLSVTVGLFVSLRPVATIELQKRFYEMINWRMEPISLPKEVRNTRIMGIFLIVFGLLTALSAGGIALLRQ